MRESEVHFVEHEGTSLAYTVFGTGPVDLLVQQALFPIDLMWDLAPLAAFLERLGRIARVIMFDTRGAGASDPLPELAAAVEKQADEILAVLDAAGSTRPSMLDLAYGTTGVALAATYPERLRSLVIYDQRTSFPYLRGATEVQLRKLARALVGVRALQAENPRLAHDPDLQRWWGRARRLMNSPAEKARAMEWAAAIDVSAILPAVRTPVLVLHRRENRMISVDQARETASAFPNARFVEIPGDEAAAFLGDTETTLREIEAFLAEDDHARDDDRPLATLLFADIVGSTEQLARVGDAPWRATLDRFDSIVEAAVAAHRGRVVNRAGDGVLAVFDGPARAVRCGASLRDALTADGCTLRVGLHTGEIELRGADVAGIAVHVASRISDEAAPGQVVVSRTVVDLTAGSGLTFEPLAVRSLKGVPGEWSLFRLDE
jgi:class 3 adenylate cyclase